MGLACASSSSAYAITFCNSTVTANYLCPQNPERHSWGWAYADLLVSGSQQHCIEVYRDYNGALMSYRCAFTGAAGTGEDLYGNDYLKRAHVRHTGNPNRGDYPLTGFAKTCRYSESC